jgi:hypothetical protein
MDLELPDIHFGEADKPPADWRKRPNILSLIDTDDELPVTPESVVNMLGYDPLEGDTPNA